MDAKRLSPLGPAARALGWLAAERTVDESLNGGLPPEWVNASAEQRVAMMGERKRAHDAAVLNARTAVAMLGEEPPELVGDRPLLPIPIEAARRIAGAYGYDQVVILGRRVGAEPQPYGEHLTTAGVDPTHSHVAAAAGRALQRFMGWPLDPDADPVVKALQAAVLALRSYELGNGSTELAKSIADAGDDALRAVVLAPATPGAAG